MNDMEVSIMLKALQSRVAELKNEENWKEKAEKKLHDEDEVDHSPPSPPQDMYDRISQSLHKNDEAKSVASERTISKTLTIILFKTALIN
jgi:hypothetical protein